MGAKAIPVLLVLAGIVLPTATGTMQTGYDPASHYLSELGATGAPNATITNAGFAAVAALLLISLVLLYRRLPRRTQTVFGLLAIALTSVSYGGAVLFPCDAGCPADGSVSQMIHNLLGILGYLGPIAGLFMIHAALRSADRPLLRTATLGTAVLMTAGFVLMTIPDLSAYRGAFQRLADFSLFAWITLALAYPPHREHA